MQEFTQEVKVPKMIFIVDDNETNLAAAKGALKDNYRVLCMTSAARMFKLLEQMTPDLILLDIEMPEMNGFEALKLLKDSERQDHKNIPVVFLTSKGSGVNVATAVAHGACDFIVKPFDPIRLQDRVIVHTKGTEKVLSFHTESEEMKRKRLGLE